MKTKIDDYSLIVDLINPLPARSWTFLPKYRVS